MIAQPTSATTLWNNALSGLVTVPGNALELVERAAGVPEPPTGDHRNVGTARRHQRSKHQADLVADAAGRVLVDHRPVQVAAVPMHGRRPIAT